LDPFKSVRNLTNAESSGTDPDPFLSPLARLFHLVRDPPHPGLSARATLRGCCAAGFRRAPDAENGPSCRSRATARPGNDGTHPARRDGGQSPGPQAQGATHREPARARRARPAPSARFHGSPTAPNRGTARTHRTPATSCRFSRRPSGGRALRRRVSRRPSGGRALLRCGRRYSPAVGRARRARPVPSAKLNDSLMDSRKVAAWVHRNPATSCQVSRRPSGGRALLR